MKFDANELAKVMEAMSNSIEKENKDKAISLYGDFIDKVIENNKNIDLSDPGDYSLLVMTSINDALKVVIEKANPKVINNHKLYELYKLYGLIENNVTSVICGFESSCCSVDKASWILDLYRANLEGEEINPDIIIKAEKEYYKPGFGSLEDWFNFIDSIINLHYGHTRVFLLAYNNLLKKGAAYVEAQKNNRGVKDGN